MTPCSDYEVMEMLFWYVCVLCSNNLLLIVHTNAYNK